MAWLRYMLWIGAMCLALGACAGQALPPGAADQAGERLLTEVPQGWQRIVDRNVGDLQMAEYYPPGADENWTQKLTVEALSGDDLPDPLVYVAGLVDEQRGLCDDFNDSAIFAGFENGYPTAVHVLECGSSKSTGRGVITLVKIIQGNRSLYTVSRIWRLPQAEPGSAADTTPAAQTAEVGAWAQTLRNVMVCDPDLPAHPCPTMAAE